LKFQVNTVGNDNDSGFWVDASGYPDMRLRKDSSTITALIASDGESYINGGALGIGVTNPNSLLQVNGNVDITGSLYISRTSTYSSNWRIWQTHAGASNYGSLFIKPSLATADFIVQDSSANYKFYVDTTPGNIGIGTASPQRLLHVYSGSAGADPTWSTDDIAIYENSTNSVIQLFSPTNYGS